MIGGRTDYDPAKQVLTATVPYVMGTRLSGLIIGAGESRARHAWSESILLAARLESILNRFDPNSELSIMNASSDAGPRTVSGHMRAIITACAEYHLRTSGLFDITMGDCFPTLSGDTADLHGASLDFGGIAKGWFLRECRQILLDAGITCAFICFGNSSILALGTHPYGDCWKVSVIDPFTGKSITERDLKDTSLSVSGNRPGYEGHIVDPRTRCKVTGHRVAVVVSYDPAEAEVLSTAAMMASWDEIDTLTSRFEGADIKIYND